MSKIVVDITFRARLLHALRVDFAPTNWDFVKTQMIRPAEEAWRRAYNPENYVADDFVEKDGPSHYDTGDDEDYEARQAEWDDWARVALREAELLGQVRVERQQGVWQPVLSVCLTSKGLHERHGLSTSPIVQEFM